MSNLFLPEMRELIASALPIKKITKEGEVSRNVCLEEWNYEENVLTGEYEKKEMAYSIEIKDLPNDVFVFKADAFPQPQALFNDVREVRKRADFILIAKEKSKQRIVFIEMKKQKGDSNVIAQLRGAVCIMDYCNSVLKHFWNASAVVSGYEPRFVYCNHTSCKSSMHPDRSRPLHDTPEKMLSLKGSSLTYQQLIRK